MAYDAFGIFIPTEDEASSLKVVKGTIAGRSTPTPPDPALSVSAPYAEYYSGAANANRDSSNLSLELMAGYGNDPNNYPADRPQISSEMDTAIRSGLMSLGIRHETKGKNNDCGNAILQVVKSAGLYQDHKVKGSLVWHKSDPTLAGLNADNNYQGKSRPPVFDCLDTTKFYDTDGETDITTTTYLASIYSDGDFVYSVAAVRNTNVLSEGVDIVLFVYCPYRRIFIKRSIISDPPGFTINAVGSVYVSWVNNTDGYTPMSPVLCRVKHFRNKLVCAFMGCWTFNNNAPKILVYQSFDDGFTWEFLSMAGWDGFYEYLSTTVPVADFRLRIASDGYEILMVWGAIKNPVDSYVGQIRSMYSVDGGTTWQFGKVNMANQFLSNVGESYPDLSDNMKNTVNFYPDNIKFGLTVDSEGRFIIAKRGEGVTNDANLLSGWQYVVFGIIEKGEIVNRNIININTDYSNNQMEPLASRNKTVLEVALFTDNTQRNDYMIIKINTASAYLQYLANSVMTCLVRYKIMKRAEWITNPDPVYTQTVVSKTNNENILFMEPPNRNTCWQANPLATGSPLDLLHGIEHRGHLMIFGYAEQTLHRYPFLAYFKSWNNVPIQYGTRMTYSPMVGDPAAGVGMTPVTGGSGVFATSVNTPIDNIQTYTIPAGLNWTGLAGDTRYHYVQTTPGAVTDFESSMSGAHEGVYRIVVSKANIPAGIYVSVAEAYMPVWDTVASQWQISRFRFHFSGLTGAQITTSYPAVVRFAIAGTFNDNVFYEFMFIRKGWSFSVWHRPFKDTSNSKLVENWTLGFSAVQAATGSIWNIGASNTRVNMGIIYMPLLNPVPANIIITFKTISTSRAVTDHYPTLSSYVNTTYAGYGNYLASLMLNYNPGGVLSSEEPWYFDIPNTIGRMRTSIKGEHITPNPMWVGNEWLSVVTSNYAKKDAILWLTMREKNTIGTNLETTPDEGNLRSVASVFLLGDGTTVAIKPTLVPPMGMLFDGINDYLIQVTPDDMPQSNTAMTIAFWIKRTSAVNSGTIIDSGGFSVKLDPAFNRIQFIGAGGTFNSTAIFTVADVNKWVFVVITFENRVLRMFKNGVEAGLNTTLADINNHTQWVIGSTSPLVGPMAGYLSKIGVFNRVLNGKEMRELFLECPYGPLVPSDFFVRVFGAEGAFDDMWRVKVRDAGAMPDSVLDNLFGSCYVSGRDGIGGVVHGGSAAYNSGDTEIILYQPENDESRASYISANAVLISNCNATSVVVYTQDTDPRVAGLAGTWVGGAEFRKFDPEYGLPRNLISALLAAPSTNGIITLWPTFDDMRPGAYDGERLLITYAPGMESWDVVGSDPSYNRIVKCIHNDERKLQTDLNLTFPGAVVFPWAYVYQLGDRMLIRLTPSLTPMIAKYWRFVFGNNARNGEKINVGTIRLGTLIEFDNNPDSPFSITRKIVERDERGILGINTIVPYSKRIKNNFDISMALEDVSGDGSDFHKLIGAYNNAMRSGDGVFIALKSTNYAYENGLVFNCAPDGDMVVEHTRMGFKSISLKLKEM